MAALKINQADTLQLDPVGGHECMLELRDRLFELVSGTQSVEEIKDRLRKLYPDSQLLDYAIKDADDKRRPGKSSQNIGKKTLRRHHPSWTRASVTEVLHGISSAVSKVSNLVRDGVSGKNENELTKYKIALIEFIVDDVIQIAAKFVIRQGGCVITRSDIRTSMHADKDLLDLFLSEENSLSITENHPLLAQMNGVEKPNFNNCEKAKTYKDAYKEQVRKMYDSENYVIRELKLMIKMFRVPLEKLPHIEREVNIIFCNIDVLLELSNQMLVCLGEALESACQDEEIPLVGLELYEIAKDEEFHAYAEFAYKRLSSKEQWRDAYNRIVNNECTMASIRTAGQNFDLAVRHLLPNYLLNTIFQFFKYFTNISELYEISKIREDSNKEDSDLLLDTISMLIKTKKIIEDLWESEKNNQKIDPLDEELARSLRTVLDSQLNAELEHGRKLPLSPELLPPPDIYRFSEPDSKDNIQLEDPQNRTINRRDLDKLLHNETTEQIPVIRCATLTKLVERLTYHQHISNIVDSFLITYRQFISDPEELLDLLIERFKIPDLPVTNLFPNFRGSISDLSPRDLRIYRQARWRFYQEYSKPVKMRVINVLKSWTKNHYYDFERNDTLLKKLNTFLDEVYITDKVLRRLIGPIKESIERRRKICSLEKLQLEEKKLTFKKEPPEILWHSVKANEPEKFDILTLHPIEFARQLTLVEFDLFRAIQPAELINVRDLGMRSRDKDKYESSPNLSRMTRHFTLLSYWIRKCIVDAEDFDKRSAIYNRAIEIMGVLRELNNFTGLLSIGSAIESAPIARLSHTEKTMTSTTRQVMENYRELNKDHQRKLQQDLKDCNPPCIPYLGSYQTKLIHAKEGNRTFIDEVDTSTISPTLSNDDFNSSFSNSPATPISPNTPLPGTTPRIVCPLSPKPPHSAAFTSSQNQFFGGTAACPKPAMINFTKQRIRAGLVCEISNYQNEHYSLSVQPQIREYIESIEPGMIKFACNIDAELKNNNMTGSKKANHFRTRFDSSTYSIEYSVPAMTKRLDDYLFEQSARIEPKNCTKPPRSKFKLPECWKSPGIKLTH